MALVSMKKQPDNEAIEDKMDEYGYGLCIHLDEDQVEALGLTQLPEPGTVLMIHAKDMVTRTMVENDGEGDEKHLSLQITDMEFGPVEGKAKSSASLLYGDD